MYKMTKNEIEMYVTTIHNAYPYAPEAAMNDMRERFEELVLADNLLSEANAVMDTLNTAILINNLSIGKSTLPPASFCISSLLAKP